MVVERDDELSADRGMSLLFVGFHLGEGVTLEIALVVVVFLYEVMKGDELREDEGMKLPLLSIYSGVGAIV